jgi:hypothetical protein
MRPGELLPASLFQCKERPMAPRLPRPAAALVALCGGVLAWIPSIHAQQADPVATAPAASPPTELRRPAVTGGPTAAATRPKADHPLDWVLKYAREERAYLQQVVRDFSCRVTKRERIEGELQEHYFIDMRVREPAYAGGQLAKPLGVMLEFLGPETVAGRRVLFVAGQNDDKLLVRKGGRRFGYVVIDIDPFGPSVRQESLMPINEIGFSHQLDRTIRTLEQDIAADPAGDNTIVEHITTAAINGRPCQMLRVTHPRRQEGLQFFSASVSIDSQLHVPVRFDVYDWPEAPGLQPPLTAEFTYTNVTLNAGLDDAVFTPAVLRGP